MKIWKLGVDFKDFKSYKLSNEDREFLLTFEKKIYASKSTKKSLENHMIELVEGNVQGDFPKFWSFAGIPMISDNAKKVLYEILYPNTELIRLKTDDEMYYLINVLTILDAVDFEKSILEKLETGLVIGVQSYSFNKKLLQGHDIFKVYLNNKRMSTEVFVSDKFKSIVEENKLKGFKFTEVWSC